MQVLTCWPVHDDTFKPRKLGRRTCGFSPAPAFFGELKKGPAPMRETEIDRLTQLAANYRSPHVRRIAALIRPALEALDAAGVTWERPRGKRYIVIAGGTMRARYVHPFRSPRRRGGLEIYQMNGNRRGRTVARISTFEDVVAFRRNPRLDR